MSLFLRVGGFMGCRALGPYGFSGFEGFRAPPDSSNHCRTKLRQPRIEIKKLKDLKQGLNTNCHEPREFTNTRVFDEDTKRHPTVPPAHVQ